MSLNGSWLYKIKMHVLYVKTHAVRYKIEIGHDGVIVFVHEIVYVYEAYRTYEHVMPGVSKLIKF